MLATMQRTSLPLGAMFTTEGTTFSAYAGADVDRASLLLFDSPDNTKPTYEIQMQDTGERPYGDSRGRVWRIGLPEIVRGQCYTFRFEGRWNPMDGSRTNPFKAALDPYAMAIGRRPIHHDSMWAHDLRSGDDLRMCDVPNFAFAPLGAVVDHSDFDWGDDRPPGVTDFHITEVHPYGFSKNHPSVSFPGTYSAVGTLAEHFLRNGTTVVELMPVHAGYRPAGGTRDYWNYSPMAFLAPDPVYSAYRDPQDVVNEFKLMVRTLHRRGLAVVIDVVYNHTCEGNEWGPTISLKGAANGEFYRLGRTEHGPGEYRGYHAHRTGCGNLLNMDESATQQLVLESLLLWAVIYHVDGIRVDLAWALRKFGSTDAAMAFFAAIAEHPVLSKLILIAEPWDADSSGLGSFPHPWKEINGEYRDRVRRYWRGDPGMTRELSDALLGSQGRFPRTTRPNDSLSLITCHDGFTLYDLSSFEMKHNEANGEENEDGTSCSWSRNWGVEGPTNDQAILAIRHRQSRNMYATLLLSRGPILDQTTDWFLQSHDGNNNPYCQNHRQFWLNWKREHSPFSEFRFGLRRLRQRFPALVGSDTASDDDVLWLKSNGEPLAEEDWKDDLRRDFCLVFPSIEMDGARVVGRVSLMVMFSALETETITYSLPEVGGAGPPVRLLDTHDDHGIFDEIPLTHGHYNVRPQSIVMVKIPLA